MIEARDFGGGWGGGAYDEGDVISNIIHVERSNVS